MFSTPQFSLDASSFFPQEDFKTHELPLARIKKIMRLEDDVAEMGTPRFMIAAEAPIVIAKACEVFILEVGSIADEVVQVGRDVNKRTDRKSDALGLGHIRLGDLVG